MSQVTRFGPDPTLEQEVATKNYVDSQGGGGGNTIIMARRGSNSTNNVRFSSMNNDIWGGIEGDKTNIVGFGFTVIRSTASFATNGKDGDTICGFRDDGVTAGSITVGAGLTGQFDSGAISVAVATLSECCMLLDSSASSSGSFVLSMCTSIE